MTRASRWEPAKARPKATTRATAVLVPARALQSTQQNASPASSTSPPSGRTPAAGGDGIAEDEREGRDDEDGTARIRPG
jgi:hypothetical protein